MQRMSNGRDESDDRDQQMQAHDRRDFLKRVGGISAVAAVSSRGTAKAGDILQCKLPQIRLGKYSLSRIMAR